MDLWITASGADADGAWTTTLLRLAEDLGFQRPTAHQKPRGAGDTLVLLDALAAAADPAAAAPGRRWRAAGGTALMICAGGIGPHGGGDDCLGFADRLSPAEQLRRLAFGGWRGLVEHYRDQPQDYVSDRAGPGDPWKRTAEQPLKPLRALLTEAEGADRDADAILRAKWRSALDRLLQPGRLQVLSELMVLLDGTLEVRPALMAADCVRRCRHDWRRAGAALEPSPVLRIPTDPGAWATLGLEARAQLLSDARLYLPPTVHARLGLPAQSDRAVSICGLEQVWRFRNETGAGAAALVYPAANRALSRLLARLLHRDRPLLHYGCTLFFPFDPGSAAAPGLRQALRKREGSNPVSADLLRMSDEAGPPAATQAHRQPSKREQDAAQAQLYFLPHVRELLFERPEAPPGPQRLAPIEAWCLPHRIVRDQAAGWRLRLAFGGDAALEPALDAVLSSVRLLRFFNDTYLLALRVEMPSDAAAAPASGDDWWHALVLGDATTQTGQQARALGRWLAFTRLARVLFPTFVEQHEEDKIARLWLLRGDAEPVRFDPVQTKGRETLLGAGPGQRLSDIVRVLLGQLFGPVKLPQGRTLADLLRDDVDIDDDRLFVNVAYALAGPPPERPGRADSPPSTRSADADADPWLEGVAGVDASETGVPRGAEATDPIDRAQLRRLLALALFVDRFEDIQPGCDGHAYDPAWVAKTLPALSLGIWDATGIQAGFTDAANAWLGYGGFFNAVVAERHVPLIYERMLLLALFYRMTLRRFNRDIAAATRDLTEGKARRGRADFRALRGRFIAFTNRYWFHEATAQLQGRRVFALQQQGLDLAAEYELIKDEMERADEYQSARREAFLADLSGWIGGLALAVGLVGVVTSYLPLVLEDDAQRSRLHAAICLPGGPDCSLELFWPLGIVTLTMLGLSWGLVKLIARWSRRRGE